MGMRVYIAGPYTKGDVAVNVRNAILVAERIVDAGHVPYVPHLTHFWHLVKPHAINFWYEYDLSWLAVCDCLIRLPGESTRADNEVAEAKKLGISVYYSYEDWYVES